MNTINTVNECNKRIIQGLQDLQPIEYDGLVCPKCHGHTVTSSGYTWCPSMSCDYGRELVLPIIITKWCVR